MIWALLILVGVVAAVHWFEYKRSVEEYTFAQPKNPAEIRTLIGEKTPIVAEIGALPWRESVARDAMWPVSVADGVDVPIAEWLKGGAPRQVIRNGAALAETMELNTGLADIDEGRQWWWMPGLRDLNVEMLEPGEKMGLHWVGAERHWIGCSDGAPLTLWLVHSRYRKYLPAAADDPWSLTAAEAPWIARVQYIEVVVRAGWCIGIPAHWGVAVKPSDEAKGAAWVWTGDQHSPLSLALSSA